MNKIENLGISRILKEEGIIFNYDRFDESISLYFHVDGKEYCVYDKIAPLKKISCPHCLHNNYGKIKEIKIDGCESSGSDNMYIDTKNGDAYVSFKGSFIKKSIKASVKYFCSECKNEFLAKELTRRQYSLENEFERNFKRICVDLVRKTIKEKKRIENIAREKNHNKQNIIPIVRSSRTVDCHPYDLTR